MKSIPAFALLMGVSLVLHAQEQKPQPQPSKPVRVESEQEHKGATHQQTRSANTPMEHHSSSSYHYHRGYKRASELPTAPAQPQADSLKR